MKKIHVTHTTTGFEEADARRGMALYKQIRKDDSMIMPSTFTYMGVPVKTMRQGKEFSFDSNLGVLSFGIVDELWVYGSINERMEREIHLAYAKRIPIICKDEAAMRDFDAMGLIQDKDYSEMIFWVIFSLIAVFSAIAFYILFRWASQH